MCFFAPGGLFLRIFRPVDGCQPKICVYCDYYEFLQKNTLFPLLYIGENNQIRQTPLVFLHKMSLFARIKPLFAIDMVQSLLYN